MPKRVILKQLFHTFYSDCLKSFYFQTKKNKDGAENNLLTYPPCHYFFSFLNVVFGLLPTYLFAQCHPFYSFIFLMASLMYAYIALSFWQTRELLGEVHSDVIELDIEADNLLHIIMIFSFSAYTQYIEYIHWLAEICTYSKVYPHTNNIGI